MLELNEFCDLVKKIKLSRIFLPAFLILVMVSINSCDDREIKLSDAISFLFSADIGQDTLSLGANYVVTMDIGMKDSTQPLSNFTLSHQVENGTGMLYQNGDLFENGNAIDIGDEWSYQPTSLGPQSLQFTLSDQNGLQAMVTINVAVLDLFLFSVSSQDTLVLDEIHDLTLDIQIKDGPTVPEFTLAYQVDNGTGVLIRNGNTFKSGDPIKINDKWTYQPTSLGIQSLQFTLTDQNGFKQDASTQAEVLKFIPVPFSISANFTQDEIFLQIEAAMTINLQSEDPEMKYVLNHEVLKGVGELRTNSGTKVNPNQSIAQGTTNWKYFPTGAYDNEIKLTIRDENGEEQTTNVSIFVSDQIPFEVVSTVQPATIRRNKSSKITLNISSTHPLFNTLNFTMQYSGNFDSQASLRDADGAVIPPNSPIAISRGSTQFTYVPVAPGTHNVTFTILSEKGNSVNSVAVVNANQLLKPEVQAASRFRLGSETCSASNDCEAPLFLDVDLGGSADGDANLGGSIMTYRLVIDQVEYTGSYNANNPVVKISNGVAKYKLGGSKVYSNVVHRQNTAIQVELIDDDGLWSDPLEISAPGSLPD